MLGNNDMVIIKGLCCMTCNAMKRLLILFKPALFCGLVILERTQDKAVCVNELVRHGGLVEEMHQFKGL